MGPVPWAGQNAPAGARADRRLHRHIRYGSLTREGWIISLSGWKDEKALVRWRTKQRHHETQEKGREEVLADYHLRVGQITKDTQIPEGYELLEQRLDETQAGDGTTVTLIDAKRPKERVKQAGAMGVAKYFVLDEKADGLIGWDAFDAVLTPGEIILLLSWKDHGAAEAFDSKVTLPEEARLRPVRRVRDYSMFDRREAPQYYPEVKRPSS